MPFVSPFSPLTGQAVERLAGHPENRPLTHRNRAQSLVELNRRLIPIQNSPFEAAAIALARDLRQMYQQIAAKAFPTHFGNNEEIFQIKSALAEKCREIVEKDSEGDRPVLVIAKQYFRA